MVSAMAARPMSWSGWVQAMPKVTGASASFYDAREYDAIVASGEQG